MKGAIMLRHSFEIATQTASVQSMSNNIPNGGRKVLCMKYVLPTPPPRPNVVCELHDHRDDELTSCRRHVRAHPTWKRDIKGYSTIHVAYFLPTVRIWCAAVCFNGRPRK